VPAFRDWVLSNILLRRTTFGIVDRLNEELLRREILQVSPIMQSKHIVSLYDSIGTHTQLLTRIIPQLSPKQRAMIVKLCQAQHVPMPDDETTLGRMAKVLPLYVYIQPENGIGGQEHKIRELLAIIEGSPLWSGLILDLARSLPFSKEDMEDIKEKGWFKEIMACEREREDGYIDFSPIFDRERMNTPLHPVLPPNRRMCSYWNDCLRSWRNWVTTQVHYPRATNKWMSHETRDLWNQYTGVFRPGMSQGDYLAFLSRTGIELGGAIEMRQVWYRAQIKPRTYFAQGGVYARTAALQNIFSELTNCSVITHHLSRLRPTRLYAKEGQHFRIYDLTSFTSSMWAQRYFLYDLAEFCRGYPITIMDARSGIICRDLGDVIWEYNQLANEYPRITYYRCPLLEFVPQSEQQIAGLLGVFGNLMTCTVAHGVIISMWAEDEDQVNVAGDDGIVPESDETSVAIRETISIIGTHEETKEFLSYEAGAIHLKRPIYQVRQSLHQKPMVIWPNVSFLSYLIFAIDDPRYMSMENLSKKDRIGLIGKEVLRFLRTLSLWSNIAEHDKGVACEYLMNLERLVEKEFDISLVGGRLTQCGDSVFWPWIPRLYEDIGKDPWTQTCNNVYSGWCSLPEADERPWDMQIEEIFVGATLEVNAHPHLSFLTKCQYLERSYRTVNVYGEDGLERLKRSILNLDPIVYTYECIEAIPLKFYDF